MNTRNTFTESNSRHKLFIVITFFVLFASLICLVINLSIDHVINWALYPIGALILLWAAISPFLVINRHRVAIAFVAFAIITTLYLILIQYLVAEKGWLLTLALPVAMLFFAALGLSLIAFSRFRSNKLYAIAATVFLFGVIVNSGVGLIVSNFIKGINFQDPRRILTTGGSAIAALLLVLAAYKKGNTVQEHVLPDNASR